MSNKKPSTLKNLLGVHKKIVLMVCMLLVCTLLGCGAEKEKASYSDAPFADKNWTFLDVSRGSYDRISFGADGSYAYYCDAGEPVGNSDLYDSYRYDEETSTITLYNEKDDDQDVIEVLSYNDVHLLLKIDGEIRDFSTIQTNTVSNFWWMEAESYLSGYELHRTINAYSPEGLITASINYDSETNMPKDTFEEFALAEDVVYFDLTLFSETEVHDGLENELNYDVSFTELSFADVEYYLQQGTATAFIWLNENMEIEKVVLFGMTIVQNNA